MKIYGIEVEWWNLYYDEVSTYMRSTYFKTKEEAEAEIDLILEEAAQSRAGAKVEFDRETATVSVYIDGGRNRSLILDEYTKCYIKECTLK